MPLKLSILIFCLLLFSLGANEMSVEFKGDENFYFESAKDMLRTGDLITPRYRGEERFQKPIFFYWLIIASFKIFGVSWFAARLPSILLGSFLALLVFSIAKLLFKDINTCLFASLSLATMPMYYRYTKLAIPETALIFFMTLALYYFLKSYKNKADGKNTILFFISIALAFLVKGPVGVMIPLLAAGAFCLIKRERMFSLASSLAGIAVFILITLPWFYLIYKKHGDTYISHVWGREVLYRLGYTYPDLFIVRYFKCLYYYTSALITRFLPYSLFLPVAFINNMKSSGCLPPEAGEKDKKDGYLFIILWAVIVFVFFTFVAEKRTHYLLAMAPPLAIMLGAVFNKAMLEKSFFSRPLFKAPYIITAAGITVFAFLLIFMDLIFGGSKIELWKLVLLICPAIFMLGFRYRDTSFMPLSLVLSLSVLYMVTTISEPLGLFMNRMEQAASIIKSEFKEGDRVGIGSHGIIPEELQAFFEVTVDNIKAVYNDDGSPKFETAAGLNKFLGSEGRVFCVIKRRDYNTFVPEEMKKNLYILGSYYVWKRRIRFDSELKEALGNIKKGLLRNIFQNEICVVSNER